MTDPDTGDGTLCGIPSPDLVSSPDPFDEISGCRACRDQAAAAPLRPSPQEILHDRIQRAVPHDFREELVLALLNGVPVWLLAEHVDTGVARGIVDLRDIVENRGPVTAALDSGDSVGLAVVVHGDWLLIIVFPADGGVPVIARSVRDRKGEYTILLPPID